jgi:hypothetical protein
MKTSNPKVSITRFTIKEAIASGAIYVIDRKGVDIRGIPVDGEEVFG